MAKPQQPELRRSGMVPALDPDATEAVLSAEDRPKTSKTRKNIPEDQQPGHHPDDEQDKPPMDKFAERLGIVAEGEEPDDAPHVEDTPAAPAKGRRGSSRAESADRPKTGPKRSIPSAAQEVVDSFEDEGSERRNPPVKLLLLGPAVTYVSVRAVYRRVARVFRR